MFIPWVYLRFSLPEVEGQNRSLFFEPDHRVDNEDALLKPVFAR